MGNHTINMTFVMLFLVGNKFHLVSTSKVKCVLGIVTTVTYVWVSVLKVHICGDKKKLFDLVENL